MIPICKFWAKIALELLPVDIQNVVLDVETFHDGEVASHGVAWNARVFQDVLVQILTDAIRDRIDMDKYNAVIQREEKDKERLSKLVEELEMEEEK